MQDLVEKVVVLRHAVEQTQQSGPAAIGILLAEKMSQYANLLASQGSLSTAITYLPDNTNQVCKTSGLAWNQLSANKFVAFCQEKKINFVVSQLTNNKLLHIS